MWQLILVKGTRAGRAQWRRCSRGLSVFRAKKRPSNGFYGTTNNTGVIAAELFKTKAGLKTTYVPYKPNPQSLMRSDAGRWRGYVELATIQPQ